MERSYLSAQEDQSIPERLVPRSNSTSNLFALSDTFSKLNVRNDGDYNSLGPNKKRHVYGDRMERMGYGSMVGTNGFPVRSSSMTAAQHERKTTLFTVKRNSYQEGLNKGHNYESQYQSAQNTLRVYGKLTPYQLQRSKMRTSFRFPNGEIYKPRLDGKCSPTSKKGGLNSKSSFLFKFREREDSTLPEDSATSYNAAQIPPLSNMDKNQDTNSLKSGSSVSSTAKSSIASSSPISSPISTVNTPTSFTESHTDDDDDGYENKTVTISYCFQNTVNENQSDHTEKLNLLSGNKVKPHTKPKVFDGKRKITSGNDRKGGKKPSLRSNLGFVLKRLWSSSGNSDRKHSKKYMKKEQITPVDEISNDFDEISDLEKDVDLKDANLNGIEIDDDETLMDANSIFDDLLSREDNKHDCRRKQLEIRQKLHETIPNDDGETSCRNIEEASVNDVLIDETLIEDFSKLGEYIIDTRNRPPPRSLKRPSLDNNECARSFYGIPTDLRQSLSGPISLPIHVGSDIVDRLRNDWEYIRFENYGTSSTNSSLSKVGAALKPTKKGVRFAQEVCLASTWSSNAYERANPEFIMNRHRLLWMMKVNPSMNSAMNEVKLELNSFKENEMVVHEHSKCFTHYLL